MTMHSFCCLVLSVILGAGGMALAQPGKDTFDAQDPEIQALSKLDYKGVDLAKVDVKTKLTAILAMNDLLSLVGGKADARVKMLKAYVEKGGLTAAYQRDETPVPETRRLTFEEGLKVAVAYVRTPKGKTHFEGEAEAYPEAMYSKTATAYYKLCQKRWAEVVYARHEVESYAVFLKKIGEFDTYMKWAPLEAERQRKAHDDEMALRMAAYKNEQDRKRAEQRALAEKKQALEHERKMKRMEYAYQHLSQTPTQVRIDDDDDDDDDDRWNRWGGHHRDIHHRPRPRPRPRPRRK